MKTTHLLAIVFGIVVGGVLFFMVHRPAEPLAVTPKVIKKADVTPSVPAPTLTTAPARTAPIHIKIPKIGVDTVVEHVGNDKNGRMDVPQGINNTAWYQPGFKPGEIGSAVIAAHYDTPTGAPGVFYKLSTITPGDPIYVTDENNRILTFKVVDKKLLKDATFPVKEIFAKDDMPRLNLITCGGIWDKNAKNYSDRLVVYAVLDNANSAL